MTDHSGSSAATSSPAVSRASAARVACLAVVIVVVWQALLVYQLRGGDWTSLFCSGDFFKLPTELQARTYVFPNSAGYDGQFYRLVAHDPWFTKGLAAYVDDARHRYGRILVPVLAHALGLGRPAWIDGAYIALVSLSLGLGVYWLALWVRAQGVSAWWGLLFLMTPAALMSADRMVVDGTLCAGFAAFMWYSSRARNPAGLWLIFALAALTRETGLLFAAGAASCELLQRRWRTACIYASAALPFLAWAAFVRAHTEPGTATSIVSRPVIGLFARLGVTRNVPGQPPEIVWLVHSLDFISVLALLLTLALFVAWRQDWHRDAVRCAVGLFALLALILGGRDHLAEAAGFGRPISPLLIWVMMEALRRRRYWAIGVPLGVSAGIAPVLLGGLKRVLTG